MPSILMPSSSFPIPSNTHISVLFLPAGMSSTIASTLLTPPRRCTIGGRPYATQAYPRGPNHSQSNDSALPSTALRTPRRHPILAKRQLLSEHRRRQILKLQSSSLPDYLARSVCYYSYPANTTQPRPTMASYQKSQRTRMTSRNGWPFSQYAIAFTDPQPKFHQMSDTADSPWFGTTVASPDIYIPSSTDSDSYFPSTSMSEWEQSQGTVGATQELASASSLHSYSNNDVAAQTSSIYTSSYNLPGDRTLSESGQILNLDVSAQYPDIHPNILIDRCGNLNLSEVTHNATLRDFIYCPVAQDNAIIYPSIVQPVVQRAERAGRRRIDTSHKIMCDFPGCGKMFSRRNSGNLARHKRSVHTQKEDRDESLWCQLCNVSFSRMDGKYEHNKRRHILR